MVTPPSLEDLSQVPDEEVVVVLINNTTKGGKIRRNLIWLQDWIRNSRD